MAIGVVIVTYGAADIIVGCLESLLDSKDAELRILVVDNASPDATVETVKAWAEESRNSVARERASVEIVTGTPSKIGNLGKHAIGVIPLSENIGFAGGVNVGLRLLRAMDDVDCFWVLNPDCVVERGTARALQECARKAGTFGVIGGRVYYASPRDLIQSEGGRVNLWSGTCVPHNLGRSGRQTPSPDADSLDYIAGSHMLVSREFLDKAGWMPEDYFLFYEEVDWCLRRGDLPLLTCPDAAVRHHAGHSIGSATLDKGPSAMAAYFMARSRMKFVRRYRPAALPYAFAYTVLKALRHLAKGHKKAAVGMLRGALGMGPDAAVLARIGRRDLPG